MDVDLASKVKESHNHGRNIRLYDDNVRKVLYFVLKSEGLVSTGEMAEEIRYHYDDEHMSNEYKIIKRLTSDSNDVSLFGNNPKTGSYLDVLTNEKGQKVYRSNFRGFLLYIYNEYLLIKNTSENYQVRYRPSDRIIRRNIRFNKRLSKRLHEVLSNSQITKIGPFLKDWSEFEKYGFNVIELLLQISIELQDQMHIDSYADTYLLRRAMERYIIELENFVFQNTLLMEEKNRSLLGLMNKYRKATLPLIRHLISKEIDRLEFLQHEVDKSEVIGELDKTVSGGQNKIIPIQKIVSGYANSINNTILEIIKIKPDYREYLLSNSFLISKPLLREMGHFLLDEISYPDAAQLLHQRDIPKQCTSDVMDFLGYKEIRKKKRKLNDVDWATGRHITFVKIKTT